MFIETHSIKSAQEYLTPSTLFVLDIDNTLLESTTSYGSYEWGVYLTKQELKKGMSLKNALEKSMPFWNKAQYQIQMKLIESDASQWLNELILTGYSLLGLTGRPSEIFDVTHKELQRNGLSFSDHKLQLQDQETLYHNGVIYVGHHQSKGEILLRALSEIEHSYDRVLFVDDQKHYLNQVEKALESSPIDFVGLHYTATSGKMEKFNFETALLEQQQLEN